MAMVGTDVIMQGKVGPSSSLLQLNRSIIQQRVGTVRPKQVIGELKFDRKETQNASMLFTLTCSKSQHKGAAVGIGGSALLCLDPRSNYCD